MENSACVVRQGHGGVTRGRKWVSIQAAQGRLHLLQSALEEMIGALYQHQLRRGRRAGYHGYHHLRRSILILCSADKQLGLAASGEKTVVIVPPPGTDRKPQGCDSADPFVAAAGVQTHA